MRAIAHTRTHRRLFQAAIRASVVLGLGSMNACDATGGTDPGPEPGSTRFYFTNVGPCELTFRFGGGVGTGDTSIDHVPRLGERNDVPVNGTGTVSVTIRSAPAGDDVGCGFQLGFSDRARYRLKDEWNPAGYCGGDNAIFSNPKPFREANTGEMMVNPSSYSGQIYSTSASESC